MQATIFRPPLALTVGGRLGTAPKGRTHDGSRRLLYYYYHQWRSTEARSCWPFSSITRTGISVSARRHYHHRRHHHHQHHQDLVHELSIRDPERFWARHSQDLSWHKIPTRSLDRHSKRLPSSSIDYDHWSWFPDGEISTAYNCVDRHVELGNGDNVAIIHASPVTGAKDTKITYRQLQDETEVLAGVLREQGVEQGDVVLIYSTFVLFSLFASCYF